jgi:hypothetical protein
MPALKNVDIDALDSLFGKSDGNNSATALKGVDINSLDNMFGGTTKEEAATTANTGDYAIANPDIAKGLWQGIKDIPATGAQLIGAADRAISKVLPTEGAKRADEYEARLKAENAKLPTDNTAFDVGRMGGQALATAPLMPVKAFQAINAGAKAIPYVGKLAGIVGSGALAGGVFGAATNSANDEGLASNVGTNALYGAAAGPVAEVGAKVAGKAVSGVKSLIDNVKIQRMLEGSGISPEAAKNTLARLTDAGYTPAQAEAELQKLGPSATLADLDPSLTTEAGGLANKGGIPTSTLKTRFNERAANADSSAHDIMENNLGPKPNYDAEKVAAALDRQNKTSGDYALAKSSNMALDVRPVVQHITDELKNAVGPEASYLKEIGSYLFDSKGNMKVDTAPLHKVRIAIDDLLDRLPQEGTSQTSGTYRTISKVRDQLDAVLKTNPDMAKADAKFAKLIEDYKGIDTGKDAFKKNYSKFEDEFNSASPEKKEFMKKGLRIQIGDLMEKATRGELSEAQRLLGKSTSNRNIVKLAFGQNGEDTLDALAKEAKFRAAEKSVSLNSATAERQAVQARPEYGGTPHESHFLTPVAQGAALDLATGTPGGATAIGAGKGAIEGIKDKLNKEKIARTINGTADLLSRQSQHGRDTAVNFLDRVSKIGSGNKTKLPVDYSGLVGRTTPLAIPAVKRIKSGINSLRGVSE